MNTKDLIIPEGFTASALPLVYKLENGKDEVVGYFDPNRKDEPVGVLLSYKGIEFVFALRPFSKYKITQSYAVEMATEVEFLLPDRFEFLAIGELRREISKVFAELKNAGVGNLLDLDGKLLWGRIFVSRSSFISLYLTDDHYDKIDSFTIADLNSNFSKAFAWSVRALNL